eukprot:4331535-Amphidinium_carterae.1
MDMLKIARRARKTELCTAAVLDMPWLIGEYNVYNLTVPHHQQHEKLTAVSGIETFCISRRPSFRAINLLQRHGFAHDFGSGYGADLGTNARGTRLVTLNPCTQVECYVVTDRSKASFAYVSIYVQCSAAISIAMWSIQDIPGSRVSQCAASGPGAAQLKLF